MKEDVSASLFVSFFVALMVHGLKLDNKPLFVTLHIINCYDRNIQLFITRTIDFISRRTPSVLIPQQIIVD